MSNAKRQTKRDDENVKGSLAWEVTEPVNLAQLDAEIVAEMGWRKPAGLLVEGIASEASEENPVMLWVTHEDPKSTVVTRVLADHTPDPQWQPEERDRTEVTVRTLLARFESGEALSLVEMQHAIRLLLDDMDKRGSDAKADDA